MSEEKKIYKLYPCPSYDVEGTETWLSDLSAEGIFLTGGTLLTSLGEFQKGSPHRIKYRMEASKESTSIFSDNMGDPDPEAIEISQQYGWKYICAHGDFHIYACENPSARELNTDPQVQELAVKAVRKRQSGNFFNLIFWCVLYPVIYFKLGTILTVINTGTGFALFSLAVFLWCFADSAVEYFHLRKLSKRLKNGDTINHRKDWKKHAYIHNIMQFIQLIAVITWVCMLLHNWYISAMDEDRIPLKDLNEELPFATIVDFVQGDTVKYDEFMSGKSFNSVKKWDDILSPLNYDFSQQAYAFNEKGEQYGGGLYVDYHEAANKTIAHMIAEDYFRMDKHEKNFEYLYNPDENADFAAVYRNNLHFITLIYQHENKVMHTYFYSAGENTKFDTDEWVSIMMSSIR